MCAFFVYFKTSLFVYAQRAREDLIHNQNATFSFTQRHFRMTNTIMIIPINFSMKLYIFHCLTLPGSGCHLVAFVHSVSVCVCVCVRLSE